MTTSAQTPMLRQYHELKQQHPGTLLFFRLGDFYELFYDDAVTGARELQITLTARHKERGDAVPMCGVPHHSAANYIARLVRKGYRVAICEQTEEASKTKKLVRREVVRIVTPGTPIDPQLLDAREAVFLAAVCSSGETVGAAFLDISTGEFRVTQESGVNAWEKIRADLESYSPRELLFPASLAPLIKSGLSPKPQTAPLPLAEVTQTVSLRPAEPPDVNENNSSQTNSLRYNTPGEANKSTFIDATLTPIEDWLWQKKDCAELLLNHFGAASLEGYGIDRKDEAVRAAGACLRYAQETQRAAADHITSLTYFEPQDHLVLDQVTVRNLELVESLGGASGRTLLSVIDETVTSMGARLLRSWLLRPCVKQGEVEARLAAVQDLFASQITRDKLRSLLKEVSDLERLIGRISFGSASPRDLNAILRSLYQVPAIRENLAPLPSSLLQVLSESADEVPEICALLVKAISDEPPVKISEGDTIRAGYSSELDELRSISRNAKQIIATLEATERTRSGISNLRIKFNNVFGYFIEVSKGNAARVPVEYERRQTLTNAERFTTPELRDWEKKVLGAEERIIQLEAELFNDVCRQVAAITKRIQGTARALAALDALAALGETAARRRFVRPAIHAGDEIEIIHGRHPVIEVFNEDPFVPNSVYLNNSTDRLLIITGPNMGGKSTVLRQTAIICILAQMGSFVPAEKARLPLLDRVWTRVGASDDLTRGRSTFMVEMTETAAILHSSTPRSLVLLDEIGRGTATFDGLSIAWAVAEYLHDSPEHAAKTLFATHYHELTELAERLPGAQNYQITATEREGEVVFLHRFERGRASKSYGIQVARLAGLPPVVLANAREVLARLERYELDVFAEEDAILAQAEVRTAEAHAAAQSAGAAGGDKLESSSSVSAGDALEAAARRAGRRKAVAQASLFDLANQKVVEEIRDVDPESLAPEEAKALLRKLRDRMM
ncbi:MAG TPA: DNA mismatch repair protein MutS [Pyrinomonadaceae bacterium]|jgi:DNA mismatch repair protein MutS|nr:DNA mismatch repair protein MutS [Pyrinomonadaceae bacterium]